jgi:predicted RNA-binding protein YlxR (DUF448 family)
MMTDRTQVKARQRTCVGCGNPAAPTTMVRVFASPAGELAVDLAGRSFGRGAHLHPATACIRLAVRKGLTKALRVPVQCTEQALRDLIAAAADRRIAGLLASAMRTGVLAVGVDAVESALGRGDGGVVVVATDASLQRLPRSIVSQIDTGQAVAWGDRGILGTLVGHSEVVVLGIRRGLIAEAVATASQVAGAVRSGVEAR